MTVAGDTSPESPPEPFVVGDPGRAYREVNGGKPFSCVSVPDTVCDAFDFSGWHVRAASVRGLAHRHYSTARQDHYEVGFCPDADRLVAVVCDGVGSLDHSHIAASVVSRKLLRQTLDTTATPVTADEWTPMFERAAGAVRKVRWNRFGQNESLMATTATIAVVEGVSRPGPWTFTLCGLGDSSIWSRVGGLTPAWRLLAGGKDASNDALISSNRTRSVPDGPMILTVEQATVEPGATVVVCSDGVGDLLDDEVGNRLALEWADPPRAVNFAAQVGVGRMTFTDDRTAVALWTP
ncbi:protein phosphatase 2C domain-containing protein [Gordonia aquimaris]|uniref:Protein phosphatase 2C domain-containing protein n=1 Tax=Gordonia aquimaris TaxID=2984863 RepID=A0A9X3I5U6_9ACTN|nr:protein phosphatase 2C domain-containing protein [Gordonia aquimaris]MCX2965400.1 protein phosphatase 2C domain-containing protein [Gordonia aquimaris]